MAAPKGNRFWERVSNPTGPPKKYKSPDELWNKAVEYFEWCEANPWVKVEDEITDKGYKSKETPTERPLTISGLCLWLGIDEMTLLNYENKEGYEELFGVTKVIKKIIYTQKFEGAAVGTFNANIIARDLGLSDKQEIHNTGETVKNTITFNGVEIEI